MFVVGDIQLSRKLQFFGHIKQLENVWLSDSLFLSKGKPQKIAVYERDIIK